MRKSSWKDSVLILVGAIMGSGTLGLPFALTKLGWYVGTAVCVLFGLAAIYSGLLLGRVENKYCRGAESFSEAAKVLVGPVRVKIKIAHQFDHSRVRAHTLEDSGGGLLRPPLYRHAVSVLSPSRWRSFPFMLTVTVLMMPHLLKAQV